MKGVDNVYYVMSDIHGCYKKMMNALEHWNYEKEHLVIMGDLIDRGPNSLEVVRELMELSKHENVTVLKGNHEDMLLSWLLNTPYELLEYYYNEHHNETFRSFMGRKRYMKSTRKQRALEIIRNFKNELNFMNQLPSYLETESAIFVHAGINLEADDWRLEETEMLWIREPFIYSSKTPEKRVFFGHTPTPFIHGDRENFNIWISNDKMKVGIDGAAAMGGQLNALKVDSYGNIVETLKF